jgi:phage-related protein
MAFYGCSFLYDGVPSELYGLRISDIDVDAINRSMGSSSMDVYEQKVYRRATPYFFGATPSPKLVFTLSAFSEEEMDAAHFQLVQKWLFSSRKYKQLQIDQIDMLDIYFSCILNQPEIVRVGNKIQGFSCQVECDSPFAWKFPTTITYAYEQAVVDDTVIFNNTSDDSGSYLYPQLVITINNTGDNIKITNESDDNRIFEFTGLLANEVLTIDCSLETVSSSTGLKRLENFNKKFLRLVSGVNRLHIQGDAESIAMTTQFVARKIGG